jgi:DNA-binding transcriptional MerR regulator
MGVSGNPNTRNYDCRVAHDRDVVASLATPQVCALAGLKPQTLDYWARTGLVTPSVRTSCGRRVPRLWSVKDVIVVRAIKALRDAGCPLSRVRRVKRLVEEGWRQDFSEVVLFWDGRDVLALRPWGDVESAFARPGQQALHLVVLPLGHWIHETLRLASETAVPTGPPVIRSGQRAQSM